MTTHQVLFFHFEFLQASALQIKVKYICAAEIDTDGDRVLSTRITKITAEFGRQSQEVEILPVNATTEGRAFLDKLREKALTKFLSSDDDKPQEYRHTMAQMFPPFRPISPLNDEFFAG